MSDLEGLRDPASIPNAPSLPAHIFNQTLAFIAFGLGFIPVLVYRTITWIIPATRPHPRWTLRRTLAVAIGRLYLMCSTYLSLPREPGAKMWKPDDLVHRMAGQGTKVKPVTASPVKGDWIVSIAKDGVWKEGDEQAQPGEKVIMYVNGGSWVMGHPQSTMFPYKFTKITGRRVLGVNHRKALSPSTAFPAQLLDLLAGYAYLLSKGFASENIILVGDSSGGHLLLALSRYLSELERAQPGCEVGMPGAMLLISPSCDLGHPPCAARSTDFLVPSLNQRAYPSLTRHFVPSALKTSPYFSPAVCGSFAYLATAQSDRLGRASSPADKEHDRRPSMVASTNDTHTTKVVDTSDTQTGNVKANERIRGSALPVWIQYGSVENLHVDIERLIERMRGDGVVVEVDKVEGGVHLDAGIAFALGERSGTKEGKEEGSSWVRLCDAVRRYAK